MAFLVRPRALPGESLSSWRQRMAWENGLRLYPVEPGRLQRADPDLCIDLAELNWISALHKRPSAELAQMTLRRDLGVVVRSIESRHHAPWWLRPKYGAPAKGHGSMYCAACLAEDTPYFRLDWRLAFNTVCLTHSVLYRDSCPHCGHPCWPAACGATAYLHERFTSFANCWHCGGLLSAQATMPAEDPVVRLRNDPALVGFRWIEVLSGLRAMCQLIIRRKAGKLILEHADSTSQETFLAQIESARAIEDLEVPVRHEVLRVCAGLLGGWPAHFLARAAQAGISRAHFDGAQDLPEWFEAVVNGQLARQNRNVRKDDVLAMAATLRSEGVVVTKAEIRRRLRWQGDIPNEWLNPN